MMSLSPGVQLGPYRIESPLGAGGMGEVYRARDTRLDRDVAIKVLPEALARDKERLLRFEREAKVLASLNHPHIAAIYGFEEANAVRFLVLELVEGQTLGERLQAGPMPVEETLHVGRQIAEAVEAAHEQGVIHRDLKPANVKITPDGKVKVLDFGLAKAFSGEASQPGIVNSPTITAQHTSPGVVLGTAAYMSPEQARGKPVDKRTDIWSFGVVLYECLGGRRPFEGETTSDLIARILEREPDWSTLPPNTPPVIQMLLRRCLAKDRNRRLRDIGDARIEIENAIADPSSSMVRLGDAALSNFDARIRLTAWSRFAHWALTGVVSVALALTGLALWSATRPVARQPIHVDLKITAGELDTGWDGTAIALSPDGTTLAYVAGDVRRSKNLFLRRLDQADAKPMPGTTGATHPFFSPDGQWLAFFADRKLKKVAVSGGPALDLCDAPIGRGGTWLDDGTIIFTPDRPKGLHRVPASGSSGPAEELTKPDPDKREQSHRWPQALPDGKHVVFTNWGLGGHANYSAIEIVNLETRERKVLQRGGAYGRYLPTGHLVFVRDATLFAAPLDLRRLELAAAPAPILEGVSFQSFTGCAQFAVSDSGTLAYQHGTNLLSTGSIVWVDRQGTVSPLLEEVRSYWDLRLSPDGRKLAVTIRSPESNQSDIWIYDLERAALTRFTFSEEVERYPVWSPDGLELAFLSCSDEPAGNMHRKSVDGSGDPKRILESRSRQWPSAWSHDGKTLVYGDVGTGTLSDIWVLSQEGERKPEPFLVTRFLEFGAAPSPDDHLIAYHTDESGRYEVYVRPFPKGSGKWQISTEGGSDPLWSPDGTELFYRTDDKVMSVSVKSDQGSFEVGKPKVLFEFKGVNGLPIGSRTYDLAPDGRFVFIKEEKTAETDLTHLRLILNWFDEVRAKVPTGKQ